MSEARFLHRKKQGGMRLKASLFLFAGLGVFFVLFIFIPLVVLFANIKFSDFDFVYHDSFFWVSLGNSLIYSLSSSLISCLLALVAAYFLNRGKIKMKKCWILLLTIPMLIPTLSVGLGIRSLFGTNGFLDKWFGLKIDGIGFPALICGSVVSSFPVVFTIIYDAMRYENKKVYDVAETMGIPKWRQFVSVTLPYLWKPLLCAFFAGFTWIFSDYGLPMEVAGKIKTLPMYLYEQVLTQFKYGRGAAIAFVLLIPAIIEFVLDVFLRDNSSEEKAPQDIVPKKVFALSGYCYLALLSCLILLPQVCFIVLAFVKSFPNDLSFTFNNFIKGFSSNAGLGIGRYLGNSLLVSSFTAIFGTIIAYISAYATSRINSKIGKWLHLCLLSSLAIPGMVFGLSYVFAFGFSNKWFYGTFAILVVVNIVHFCSTPYLMAKNALSKLNRNYEVVGDTIGTSRLRIFFQVILPNTRGTIVEMVSFFFANSMITISAIAFLCTYSNQPLSILISTFDKQGSYEMQAVVSFLILAVNLVFNAGFKLLEKTFKRKNNNMEEKEMDLTRFEFDLLTFIERNGPKKLTQRQIADSLTISVGLVNKILRTFLEDGCLQINVKHEISITEKGLKILEPYRVRKAIVIAAGFGSRLVPVTLDRPKPLVIVNGTRIIDTLLDALYAADIKSIYIVRGYKGEQFNDLLVKYPTIQFIENPLYNESNNISSVFMAKDLIDRCYICEADLLIRNPSIIQKYQFCTNYLSSLVKETDDWCFTMKGNYIKKVAIGGENVEQMIGISYWNEKDSETLRHDIDRVFHSRGGKENYWDNVPLKICQKDFKVETRECHREDVTEIDNFSELVLLDPSYKNYKEE